MRVFSIKFEKGYINKNSDMLHDDIQDFIRTIGGKMNQYVFAHIEQKYAKRATLYRPM